MYGYFFSIVSFLVSSSHDDETFVEENRWFWEGGYRRISQVSRPVSYEKTVTAVSRFGHLVHRTPATTAGLLFFGVVDSATRATIKVHHFFSEVPFLGS